MQVKLENDQLTQAVHAAIISAIGEDGKSLIINQVVEYLTTAPASSYGSKQPSPLLQAINDASRQYATKFVVEKMSNDADFKTKLDDLYKAALDKAFGGDRGTEISDRMADALVKALTGNDRY